MSSIITHPFPLRKIFSVFCIFSGTDYFGLHGTVSVHTAYNDLIAHFFSTGMLSSVSMDSSTLLFPFTTTASRGIRLPVGSGSGCLFYLASPSFLQLLSQIPSHHIGKVPDIPDIREIFPEYFPLSLQILLFSCKDTKHSDTCIS